MSVLLALVCLSVGSAHAQETRAGRIAAAQAEKARQARAYAATGAERRFVEFKDGLLRPKPGIYPALGSIYSGGGFTLGVGYRRFYGDRSRWDIKALYSIKAYKLFELSTDSIGHGKGRVDFHARAGWRDATQVNFHGLGIDSPEAGANFRMKQAFLGGDVNARPSRWSVLGAGLTYEDFTLEEGRGSTPSVEDVHTEATAPGLGASPGYLHSSTSAAIDWRPSGGYARRGGFYGLAYHNYADRDGTYSFDRMDVEAVQHLPILRETWVLSLRGRLQSALDADDTVPYFMLPSLGSGSTLRGYHSWRFRDRHGLLVSAEWRWIVNRLGLDAALFYDAGQVAARTNDLRVARLKSAVGIGLRFHTPQATPVRIDIAHGQEGTRLVISGRAAF